MRFLCKKCGAQSPGDLSEVEVRNGALVFTCKACGASATLVESRDPDRKADSQTTGAASPEKGIVEPDEDELVDLGQATISRMLGRNVRIVADEPSAPEAAAPPPVGPTFVAEGRPHGRGRFVAGVVVGVVLAAVVTFALLDARQPGPTEGGNGTETPAPLGIGALPAAIGSVSREGPRKPDATRIRTAVAEAAPEVAKPARPVVEEPSPPVAVRELKSEESKPPSLLPSAGPAAGDLEDAFRRVRPGVRMCALQERRRHPDASLGDEAVTVTFAPSGEVLRVSFADADLGASALGECLAGELQKARVEPFDGETSAVRRVLSLSVSGGSGN